jgi:hypothetical protein
VPLPRSSRTIWKILRRSGCISTARQPKKEPLEQKQPLEEIQADFKEASTVPSSESPEGKRQHIVEICNFIDAGTSVLLSAQVRSDFHAQTALEAVITFLRQMGRPQMLTFDNDPRWVGSHSGRDFPSSLQRFLRCVEIVPNVCPPHRPDKNAYVERYHRSYGHECLDVHRPTTLQEVREVTEEFLQHYNWERPHQGRSCGNRPPRVAFPTFPEGPPLPQTVDPNRWLKDIDGHIFVRKVGHDGCVDVNLHPYYIDKSLAGQFMALSVQAAERSFAVWHGTTLLKRVPIKQLYEGPMAFDDYCTLMVQEALAEDRRLTAQKAHLRQLSLW